VGLVDVTYIKAWTFARKAARTKGRETAFVTNLCQSVGLIHKLGKLTTTKEFSHGSNNRANINQGIGCCLSRLLDAHALFDNALHTQQTNTELRLDQLTHTTNTAIAQVVDIVLASMT